MRPDVLRVGGAVLEPAHHLDDGGVEPCEAEDVGGLLAGLAVDVVHLTLHPLEHGLDRVGVDDLLRGEPLEGDAGDLAAHGVLRGDADDAAGGVVLGVDAAQLLERGEVEVLCVHKAALHLVARQGDVGAGAVARVAARVALDGGGEHLLGAPVAVFGEVVVCGAGVAACIVAGRLGELCDEAVAGLGDGHAGQLCQPVEEACVARLECGDLVVIELEGVVDDDAGIGNLAGADVERGGALEQRGLAGGDPVFEAGNLGAPVFEVLFDQREGAGLGLCRAGLAACGDCGGLGLACSEDAVGLCAASATGGAGLAGLALRHREGGRTGERSRDECYEELRHGYDGVRSDILPRAVDSARVSRMTETRIWPG